MLIKDHVRKLNDERLVVVCPKTKFERQQHVRKIMAIEKLLKDKDFLEENKVIEQELKIYKEDLLFEINGEFEQIYMPENHKCSVFNSEEDALNFETNSSFNRFLSNICLRYFEHAPKINNELINRQNISAQVKKAEESLWIQFLVKEILQNMKMVQVRRLQFSEQHCFTQV